MNLQRLQPKLHFILEKHYSQKPPTKSKAAASIPPLLTIFAAQLLKPSAAQEIVKTPAAPATSFLSAGVAIIVVVMVMRMMMRMVMRMMMRRATSRRRMRTAT